MGEVHHDSTGGRGGFTSFFFCEIRSLLYHYHLFFHCKTTLGSLKGSVINTFPRRNNWIFVTLVSTPTQCNVVHVRALIATSRCAHLLKIGHKYTKKSKYCPTISSSLYCAVRSKHYRGVSGALMPVFRWRFVGPAGRCVWDSLRINIKVIIMKHVTQCNGCSSLVCV